VPSAGRDKLVASSGLEPLSVRLECAGPHSLGEAELERVMGVEPIKTTLATLNLEASPGISPGYEVLQTPAWMLCHDAESVLWGD